ncbi:MAG: SCO family protein [Alphaproteobacteria bacterium]
MKLRHALLAAGFLLSAEPAATHDPSLHAPATAKVTAQTGLAAKPPGAMPFDNIGGPFTLTDHHGTQRTDADFHGSFLLVFFGYADCQSICPVGLQHMTAALDALGASAGRVQPVLITVDPENDTPGALAQQMPKVHPRLLGLTGTPKQVQKTMQAYQVESSQVSRDGDGNPIYAHGSFIYLMRPDGKFATLIPPVLGADQMAEILRRHIN